MSIEELATEALRLPPEKRAQLAESLWESLGDPFQAAGELDEKAAINLALQRDGELESGQVMPISHEDLMARLRR